MVKKAEELFKMADVNGDGHLTIEEFTALMEQAKQKYPQVQVLFSKAEHRAENSVKNPIEDTNTLFTNLQQFQASCDACVECHLRALMCSAFDHPLLCE